VGRSQQAGRDGEAGRDPPAGLVAPAGLSGGAGPDEDDTGCPILHVDMDAFFASVEVRRRPELRGRPVVVGGTGVRGVVSSASYEARAFGIRSAMPGVHARRLCPAAVFLPPDFSAYSEASRAVMKIFADSTPLVEQISVDEAFLDVSGAVRLLGRPARIAAHIRERVREEQSLTCSVGVAATKFLAKLASTRAKPDGLLVVSAGHSLEFLHPLSVDALWGVGERTAEVLRRLGLRTVADVANAPVGMLRQALGDAAAAHLHDLSWARDPRRVATERAEKSAGAEMTFDIDVAEPEQIRHTLLNLSTGVAARLRAGRQVGRTVALKIRLASYREPGGGAGQQFRTLNRSRTLAVATDVAREIFDTAWALFAALPAGERIRLVGVRVEGLSQAEDAPRQLALGERERGWREAERAADAAADRFGRGVVAPASLLRPSGAGRPLPDISTTSDDPRPVPAEDAAERNFDPLSDHVHPS
jgi:DNA polymerase IV